MKKIVALVLSLVMVLGLATTAFGAVKVPQWITNAADGFDVFDGNNVKVAEGVELVYNPAEKPSVKNDFYGNVTFYSFAEGTAFSTTEAEPADYDDTDFFVLVSKYEAGCIAVKASDKTIDIGTNFDDVDSQSVPGAFYFLKPVAAVHYNWDAEAFAAWGTKCGEVKKPADFDKKADYATVEVFDEETEKFVDMLGILDDIKEVDDAAADEGLNVMVDGVIYTLVDEPVAFEYITHVWVASEYAEKDGAVTKYTCSTCKVVGTAVTSPYLAPQDAEIEQLGNNSYVYFYTTGAGAVAGDKVESAQTFDAGIAMYVGMSVMAAAGSAVVLKKKD